MGMGMAPSDGEGSGFIINDEGYILTNNHVVENARAIIVRLHDGQEYPATVIGTDPLTDIALIKIESDERLPVVPLGDSEESRVGDWVIAIGSPLGLDFTVTAGIVSAIGRDDVHPNGQNIYENFIQTDASINPGNSGGPLINLQGEVIGINAAINRLGQGIGFAIPINYAKVLLPQLLANGSVTRSCIGIIIQGISQVESNRLNLDSTDGVLVESILENGPADSAGLRSGDIITGFNGEAIEDPGELRWLASVAGVESTVPVNIIREGRDELLQVTLGEMPCDSKSEESAPPDTNGSSLLGVDVSDLDEATRQELALPTNSGARVVAIAESSPALGSGLRVGDVILEVGSTAISGPSEFNNLVSQYRQGDILRLRIRRGNAWVFIAFTL
jgi:serine protease Do